MKIKLADSFVYKLNDQVEYIARDKPGAARNFKRDILALLKKLKEAPLSHRKSIYFDDASIREVIFKGYKIVYKMDEEDSLIIVFGLIKEQEKL